MASISNFRARGDGLVKFDVDFGRLIEALERMPDRVFGDVAKEGLRLALVPTMHAARALAPVDEGRLASSVHVRNGRRRGSKVTVLVSAMERGRGARARAANQTYYGYFQEKGYRHHLSGRQIPGKHYMQAAIERTQGEFSRILEEFVGEAVQQYFGN